MFHFKMNSTASSIWIEEDYNHFIVGCEKAIYTEHKILSMTSSHRMLPTRICMKSACNLRNWQYQCNVVVEINL